VRMYQLRNAICKMVASESPRLAWNAREGCADPACPVVDNPCQTKHVNVAWHSYVLERR